MGRRPSNNPRQKPLKSCGCQGCTAKFRPGTKHTRKDCIGNWEYRYTGPDGSGQSLTRDTYDEAVADGQREATKVRDRTWIDPKRSAITLRALWAIWEPLQVIDDNTRARDGSLWRKHIEPKFGGWPIIDIGYADGQEWVNSLSGSLEASSIVKTFQILDRMMGFALRDRRVPYNALEGIKLPTVHKKHPEDRKPPTYAQLRKVRRALPAYQRTLQIVAQETGMRWGELVGLRACWVDLDGARIQVREVVTEVGGHLKRKPYPKEDASMRTIPLTPRALGALRAHMAKEKPSRNKSTPADGMLANELVFHGRNRKNRITHELYRAPLRRSAFRRTWIAAITAAGVMRVVEKKLPDGTIRKSYWPDFHDQRHTVASHLANLGVPEVIVQDLLGHRRASSVTWLYTHAATDVAGQVLAAFADRSRKMRGSHLRVVA